MEIFGEVTAILNEKHLLVKIEPPRSGWIHPPATVKVFSALQGEQIASLGLSKLYTLKGTLRILVPQGNGLFLAERYVEGERTEQRPVGLGALPGLFTQNVKVGGTWSARLDESQSLNIKFENEVRVGDPVGDY